jgi:Holliday junction resolvase RusA-like endonuclease
MGKVRDINGKINYNFFVEGEPVPAKRMTQAEARLIHIPEHRVKPQYRAKWLGVKRHMEWKSLVHAIGMKTKLDYGLECNHKAPFAMSLEFVMPRPKSMKQDKPYTKTPDLDNLSKIVKDGLNGVFYKDDSQIVVASGRKRYAGEGERTGVWVTIREEEV